MTRSVRDTALLLDVLGGPTPGDHVRASPRPARPSSPRSARPVEPLRIAWWAHPWSGDDPDPVVAEATAATAALLEGLGHHVESTRRLLAGSRTCRP